MLVDHRLLFTKVRDFTNQETSWFTKISRMQKFAVLQFVNQFDAAPDFKSFPQVRMNVPNNKRQFSMCASLCRKPIQALQLEGSGSLVEYLTNFSFEQVLSCWVVIIISIPLPQHQHTFCQRQKVCWCWGRGIDIITFLLRLFLQWEGRMPWNTLYASLDFK